MVGALRNWPIASAVRKQGTMNAYAIFFLLIQSWTSASGMVPSEVGLSTSLTLI